MYFYVYLVICRDNTIYCGFTNNVEERVKRHNSGRGAKYTKNRRPVKLVYHEEFSDRSSALKREYEIKQFTRLEKIKLIYANKKH